MLSVSSTRTMHTSTMHIFINISKRSQGTQGRAIFHLTLRSLYLCRRCSSVHPTAVHRSSFIGFCLMNSSRRQCVLVRNLRISHCTATKNRRHACVRQHDRCQAPLKSPWLGGDSGSAAYHESRQNPCAPCTRSISTRRSDPSTPPITPRIKNLP